MKKHIFASYLSQFLSVLYLYSSSVINHKFVDFINHPVFHISSVIFRFYLSFIIRH